MFPTDNEFLTLYALYSGWFIFLLAGTLFFKSKKRYFTNLVLYFVYAGIMAYFFSNKENFRYGGSLTVLFYGGIFLLVHLLVFISVSVYRYFAAR